MPMPVDQTGENIAFVMLPGMVEAHIQIQYRGEAAKFSWILPVQALPEIEVGTQGLFDKLLQATVPTYSFTVQPDFCGQVTSSSAFTGTTGGDSTSTGAGGSGGGPPGGPVIVFQKPVGAFDVTVLQGGTTDEVVKWLTDNQYQVPTNASTLLDGYVANHFLFVAVKLTGGKGLDEIHPLVVRYPSNLGACVPLKLTSVAAVNDMGVRTFFLGTRRVVPKNFKHVELNLVKFDWFNAATSYNTLVSRAVDSPVAMGKAWVTEYAGPTAVVGAQPITGPSWNAAPFVTTAPVGVVQLLQSQNLMSCFNGNMCTYNHTLLLPLLRQYLPPPSTLTVQGMTFTDPTTIEGYFYSCLACYQDKIDMTKWNGQNFANDLSKRIIDPSKHADAVLMQWPYLTRMYTTLSPSEMDLDPEFLERDGLDMVPRINLNSVERITCDQRAGMVLPDGKDVALASQGTWPLFTDRMPWAAKIDEIQPASVVHLVDNSNVIQMELDNWNHSQSWPPPSTTGPTTGGNPTTSTTGGSGGAGGANGAGPVAVDNGSCGCRAVGSRSAFGAPWAAAALLGLFARLARRRARS